MASMSRRQLFRRSKAGCWNCRSKKKKCDESRPHCTRCVRAAETCRYPSESGASPEFPDSSASIDYSSTALPQVPSLSNISILQPAPSLVRMPSAAGSSSYPSETQQTPLARHSPLVQHQSQHFTYHHARTSSHANIPSTWDDIAQQYHPKRPKYDSRSSPSASSRSSAAAVQDQHSQPLSGLNSHSRQPSSSSLEGLRKQRESWQSATALPPLVSVPTTTSASVSGVDTVRHRDVAAYLSPRRSARSVMVSPYSDREHPCTGAFATATSPAARHSASNEASLALDTPFGSRSTTTEKSTDRPESLRDTTSRIPDATDDSRLVLDYATSELDPQSILQSVDFLSVTSLTQVTKGARDFFVYLHKVANLPQGQAMSHALAALTAVYQGNANAAYRKGSESSRAASATPHREAETLQGRRDAVGKGGPFQSTSMLNLADRHLLAAIKALQSQRLPSRRRRFSIIDNAKPSSDELPIGSNAGVMLMLIACCDLAGKSLMLPSYLEQCEQFLIEAIEHISSHRMFPSVNGEIYSGTPECPPDFATQDLSHAGLLLIMGTYVGLFEIYVAQYVAVTNWDYNPARLRRLQPFNCTESDLDTFNATRRSVSEAYYSISMVTLELVLDTMHTVQKFKRVETALQGREREAATESDISAAGLEALALRQEVGLLIKDLEAGTFWHGAAKAITPAEEVEIVSYLHVLSSNSPLMTTASQQPLAASDLNPNDHGTSTSSGLFFPSPSGIGKRVNRVHLGDHLFRNALIVELYVSVFHMDPCTETIQDLVTSSISLLEAVPETLELGLLWPVVVLGSHIPSNGKSRAKVQEFLKRSQWKGSAGPFTAEDVLERVWQGKSTCWREGVRYFGNPLIT